MRVEVEVQWPEEHYWGMITDEHPRSNLYANATPVLVFSGVARKPTELNPDVEVIVTWWRPRTGRVWEFIQKAIDAGYPIKIKTL